MQILSKFVKLGHDPERVKTWGMKTIGQILAVWHGENTAQKELDKQRKAKK